MDYEQVNTPMDPALKKHIVTFAANVTMLTGKSFSAADFMRRAAQLYLETYTPEQVAMEQEGSDG